MQKYSQHPHSDDPHSDESDPDQSPSSPSMGRRPKRLRRSQLPGLTAKGELRTFVKHNYVDRSIEVITTADEDEERYRFYSSKQKEENEQPASRKGKKSARSPPFPLKLHMMLTTVEKRGMDHIVSWAPHGRAFVISDTEKFTSEVTVEFFRQTKLTSFLRQLNLYGFTRISQGKDKGAYYHEYFLRGTFSLADHITRVRVKGTKVRAASSPDSEPDLYTLDPMPLHAWLKRSGETKSAYRNFAAPPICASDAQVQLKVAPVGRWAGTVSPTVPPSMPDAASSIEAFFEASGSVTNVLYTSMETQTTFSVVSSSSKVGRSASNTYPDSLHSSCPSNTPQTKPASGDPVLNSMIKAIDFSMFEEHQLRLDAKWSEL